MVLQHFSVREQERDGEGKDREKKEQKRKKNKIEEKGEISIPLRKKCFIT